jgi:exodeoxyribonuclease VII large subunit
MDETLSVQMLPIQGHAQRLDELVGSIGWSMRHSLSVVRQQLMTAGHELRLSSPLSRIRGAAALVPQLIKRFGQGMQSGVSFRRQAVRSLVATLDSLSPLAILARGYSIVQTVPEGAVVRRAADVAVGQDVLARLAEGHLLCTVQDVLPKR